MPLSGFSSCCQNQQRIIVSEERGRKHRANNVNQSQVNHYHVDGEVITDNREKKCDYLLINENTSIAYLIELKGKRLGIAAEQLENTERLLQNELASYQIKYRIVSSQGQTHKLQDSSYRIFKNKKKDAVDYKVGLYEEKI